MQKRVMIVDDDGVEINPGSDSARLRGCTCAVLDNGHGRVPYMGWDPETGEGLWSMSMGCPLHCGGVVAGEEG